MPRLDDLPHAGRDLGGGVQIQEFHSQTEQTSSRPAQKNLDILARGRQHVSAAANMKRQFFFAVFFIHCAAAGADICLEGPGGMESGMSCPAEGTYFEACLKNQPPHGAEKEGAGGQTPFDQDQFYQERFERCLKELFGPRFPFLFYKAGRDILCSGAAEEAGNGDIKELAESLTSLRPSKIKRNKGRSALTGAWREVDIWFPGRPFLKRASLAVYYSLSGMERSFSIALYQEKEGWRGEKLPALKVRLDSGCRLKSAKIWEYGYPGKIALQLWLDERLRTKSIVFADRKIQPLEEIYREEEARGGKSLEEILSIAAREDRVLVTVLDSGVDYNHPQLAYKILRLDQRDEEEIARRWESLFREKQSRKNSGLSAARAREISHKITGLKNASARWDFTDEDPFPYDYLAPDSNIFQVFHHGTRVAGLISSGSDDIALLPLRLLPYPAYKRKDFYAAVQYAYERGSRIVNISMGGRKRFIWRHLGRAFKEFQDMLFVAAAGNEGRNNDGFRPNYPSSFDFPNIISVASVDKEGELSAFSDYGKRSVDIAAFGERVFSTEPEDSEGRETGTSMAAPQVARAAAKIKFVSPGSSPERIIDIIGRSADQIPALRGKVRFGGVLNEERALALAIEEAAETAP